MAVLDSLELVTTSPTTAILLSSAVVFTVWLLATTYLRRPSLSKAPPKVPNDLPLTGALGYWTQRWDFFRHARAHAPTGNFSFHAGPNTVVALSGDRGRKLFFESRDLNFNEGYAVLFGGSPSLKNHDKEANIEDDSNFFPRRLTTLLKNDMFRKKLPKLLSDVQDGIDAIKAEPSGITNPFESVYRIVFRLTIRMVGAEELADDPVLLESFLKYFMMIESTATATTIMFPSLPTPGMLKRTYAGARLYMIVEKIVKQREKTGEKHDDALQFLLDQGDRMFKIIEFTVGALFAGLLNTGINAAWILIWLTANPDWLEKVREEVRSVAAKHATDTSKPLLEQLSEIPIEAWENDFPISDMCLKESIRINALGTAIRKNTSGKDIPIGDGSVIPPNAFAVYHMGDVHYDPEAYPNPMRWDPGRYLPERAEDKKKSPYGYIGWGVARHPCLGMRFAKLENNVLNAYFVAAFDFELVNQKGQKVTEMPMPDLNGHTAHKPKVPPYLKVTAREK
ncbi:cytochrome P450 [Dendryphion nanum]|uniref:Cytochrome P450 n=1 Tax=Dendryphion nanum TaxID=256645 RepID=A0A9P9D636_9PLEO|nr:cytochrome P450 [Dendryphion nanum]